MTFTEEWVATAARIAALKDDAQLRAQQARTHDSWGVGQRLANAPGGRTNESLAIVPPEGSVLRPLSQPALAHGRTIMNESCLVI
jgi:hypothetical protein